MKRSIALAAVATLASGAALAQSNVTIYGRLNVSVERQKQVSILDAGEGGFVTQERDIWALQNASSRIGFKGSEDLGGGLKAFFLIEHGFNVDTGAASGAMWGRESNVGLEGSFGKVRLGNMGPTAAYFATADYISMHNHDTGTSSDAFYLYPGDVRNTIAYTTPSISGFQAEVQVGLKETDAAGAKNTFVLAGNYDAGPLHLGASYVSANQGFDTLSGDGKEFGLRGLYEFGPFTVGAYFINNKIEDDFGNELKRNAFRLSGMYVMGASEFHLNVGKAGKFKANGTTVDGTDATQATIAYNYNLSKRTKVYAFYTKLSGDFADFYAQNVGGVKSAFALGLRHNF
ncbi:MAG: porin [Piscinibacter sp.]|nr:porin [Piscinibacter sp.]